MREPSQRAFWNAENIAFCKQKEPNRKQNRATGEKRFKRQIVQVEALLPFPQRQTKQGRGKKL